MSQDNDCELYSDKLIYIASRLNRLPLEKSIKTVDSMSALITIEKCPVGVMFAHIAKGRYSMEKGDHSSAKEQYENALKISIDEEDVIRQKIFYPI